MASLIVTTFDDDGNEYTEDNSKLNMLLNIDFPRKISGTTAALLIREAYDSDYSLNTGKFGVSMPQEEKIMEASLYEYWLREYRRCNINSVWGFNFDEFLMRPRAHIRSMCNVALVEQRYDDTTMKELANMLKK